jgi:Protein of unknown function DUF58
LELTPPGNFLVWVAVGLLIPAALFANLPLLGISGLLLLGLLLNGIRFHNQAENAKSSIAIETNLTPKHINPDVNSILDTSITNNSLHHLHVVGLTHDFPSGLDAKTSTCDLIIHQRGTGSIRTEITPLYPGRFTVQNTNLELQGRFFKHGIELPTRWIVNVRPTVYMTREIIEAPSIEDVAINPSRRGAGTDLAGIRPSSVLDDLRRIDWKATARMGKMMSKEFYLEEERAVMLVIDSTVKQTLLMQNNLWMEFLIDAERLLGSIRTSTSVGLAVYSERGIDIALNPEPGIAHRTKIIDTISNLQTGTPTEPTRDRLLFQLETMAQSYSPSRDHFAKGTSGMRQASSFTLALAPFFESITRRHGTRVRKEGEFKALQEIDKALQPSLIIIIASDNSNPGKLVERVRMAISPKHRVILVILSTLETLKGMQKKLSLGNFGVQILRCPPNRLRSTIRTEILQMTHERIPVRNLMTTT